MGFRGEAETMTMYVYPNSLLSLHPDYTMTHTLWPKVVDRTEIVCAWSFHPAEMAKPEFQAEAAIEFWDLTKLSQAGMESCAYTPGPYSTREEMLHLFDRRSRERIALYYCPSKCSQPATNLVGQASACAGLQPRRSWLRLAALWGRPSACGGLSARPQRSLVP
jgi:hypothetical protein